MSSGSYDIDLDLGNRAKRTWSGANWPKLAKGVRRTRPLPDNPYSVVFAFTQSIPFKSGAYDINNKPYLHNPANYVYLSGYAPSLSGAEPPVYDSNLELKCLGKINERIRGSGLNAAVALAELPEAVDQVVGMIQKLGKAYGAALRGDIAGVIRNLTRSPSSQFRRTGTRKISRDPPLHIYDVSGAHLAATYGWVPLMQDIFDLMKFVENYKKERSLVVRARAGKRQINIGVTGGVGVSKTNPPWMKLSRVQIIAKLKEQPSIWDDLSVTNPATVVWEKIPFSFVLDWAVPVGQYLDAMTYVGLFTSTSVKSVLLTSETHVQWKPHYYPFGSFYQDGVSNARRGSFVRTVGPITVPRPSLKTIQQVFSIPHLQNAAALITSALTQPGTGRFRGSFNHRGEGLYLF